MTMLEWLVVAWAVAFVINAVAYFMPPTWSVVAFFLIAFSLPVWPLAIGCAIASTAGRCGLYLISARWGRRLLPASRRQNVDALGRWLNARPSWRGVVDVLVYSLGPIPSNDLFIAAGLSGARLWPVAVGFLPGRLVSYPALALAAKGANDHFDGVLTKQWHDPKWLVLELLSIAGLIMFSRLDWPRILHLPRPALSAPATQQSQGIAWIVSARSACSSSSRFRRQRLALTPSPRRSRWIRNCGFPRA